MSEGDESDALNKWHSKRSLVIAGIFFIVVSMAIVGISVATHVSWLSSPEKALLDAVQFSTKTPATYTVASKDIKAAIAYDGSKQAIDGTYKGVQFNAVVSGNLLYVKSETPAELVKLFVPTDAPNNLAPVTDAIIQRITGKWIVVSLERIPFKNAVDSKNMSCVLTTKTQLITNEKAKKELVKLYKTNRFVAAEKASETEKSNVLNVTINDDVFHDFIKALQQSKVYSSQKTDCEDFVNGAVTAFNREKSTATVLLSKSKNALQKATITNAVSGQVTVDVVYGDVGSIPVPTDTISYDSITGGVVQTMIQTYLNGVR